ncbi:MAG: TetR/AcrR family transcriptional regulator [Terracidiphilus sp.]|jgi:AcrR family transcriptional regulator
MLEVENRTRVKRTPRQERSQARFESVLEAALRLFAARGYEAVSMREIAREAKMPIASVYQYFPMKLAIVREMWTRYTSTISETLAAGICRSIPQSRNEAHRLIGMIIDRMAELQTSNPAFIEIWSCVAASMELRRLNVEDTLQNARVIADALQKMHPESDPSAVYDRALIAIQMASSTTRFALVLPEPHRSRILLSLKAAISLLIDPVTLNGTVPAEIPKTKVRRAGTVQKSRTSRKAATAKAVPSSR